MLKKVHTLGDDLIAFKGGWRLSSLSKTPIGWCAVIEKDISMAYFPHYNTKFKVGTAATQSLALKSALGAKGYAQEDTLHGTKQSETGYV